MSNLWGLMVEAVAMRKMKDLVEAYLFRVALAKTQVETLQEKTQAFFSFTQAAKERFEIAKDEALMARTGNGRDPA